MKRRVVVLASNKMQVEEDKRKCEEVEQQPLENQLSARNAVMKAPLQ
jgi:hypothetical protein